MAKHKRTRIKNARAPFHLLCKPIGAQCNLRCEHCFYLEKADLYPDETGWRMSDAVLEEFTRTYIQSQPEMVREIQFAWQGGEPTLMGLDFFRRAVELQKRHARPGLAINNALQTNATLLDDEWGRFLHDENFLLGISIDGPEELHNRFRPFPDGSGSFAAAMKGLEAMMRCKVEFNTLTCVQSDNANHPVQVYDFLKSTGSTFMQFIPIVEFLDDGATVERTVSGEQWGSFLNGLFDHWVQQQDIGKVFVQHFDAFLGIVMGHPSSICVHSPVCGRALVIEHNGDIYSCDHFVTPNHLLGNLTKDSMAWMVDSERQNVFGRDKSVLLPEKCRACTYLRLCQGGCPVNRYPSGEQANLSALCDGYYSFFEHSVPIFSAMAQVLKQGKPACDWMQAFTPGSNQK